MINYILLGVIQGITEFLPISSSGHLILFKDLTNLSQSLAVDVSLHMATLCAVLFFYKKQIKKIALGSIYELKQKQFGPKLKYVFYLFIATIPAVIFGLLLQQRVDSVRNSLVVAIMLLVVSFLMLYDYFKQSTGSKHISLKQAVVIGFAQAMAIIPGTSRSGITITLASIIGVNKTKAAEFSFLLSVPVIFGAFLLSITKVNLASIINLNILVAFLSSFIVGVFSIKVLLKVLNKFGFLPFAIYRIALALIVLLFLTL